jgi:hypothetical protein
MEDVIPHAWPGVAEKGQMVHKHREHRRQNGEAQAQAQEAAGRCE